MQKRSIIIFCTVLMLIVTACGQPEDLPTAVAFPTDVPPTEDPEAQAVEVEDVATETPFVASTLPPTWTPTFEPTETLIPTETEIPDTFTPQPTIEATPSVCDTFAADPELSTREFIVGETPVVAWTPVEGAVLYRVFLYRFNGRTMRDDIYTDLTTWSFDPNVFELGENYLWAVWPLDSIGDQMCFERGLELLPQRPPLNVGGGG